MAKRANGEGTLRKRSDGRWEARYVSPEDNKQHSIYGKTQKAVREKLQKTLQELSEYADLQGQDMPVSAWLDIWLKNYTSNIKPATLYSYTSAVRSRIKPYIGDKSLRQLTTNDIQNIYITMKNEGLTPKTIKDVHGVIHKALSQAVKLRYIKYNVSEACVIPKQERKEIQPMDNTDIAKFLRAVQGDEYEPVFFIALFTGMRQGEILGLTWSCIDFDNGMIHLSKQLLRSRDKSGCYFGSLKNGKPRTIYISNSVAEVLMRRKEAQLIEKQNAGSMWTQEEEWRDLVFTN